MTKHEKIWLLGKILKRTYVHIKNGVASFVDGSGTIPVEHLAYQKMQPNGYYIAEKNVCDGKKCKIGKPDLKCGAYSPQKCGVYFLSPIDKCCFLLNFKEVMKLLGTNEEY